MKEITSLVRKSILDLTPYSSARSEFNGVADVWLDANENPFRTSLNRYPDPLQKDLKSAIAHQLNISTEHIFLGNGSDEAIDLLIRVFCDPRIDRIVVTPPTYGMYSVSARVNDVAITEVPLGQDFQLSMNAMIASSNESNAKLTFICSPNNPTGNLLNTQDIQLLASSINGVLVVDQAYIDFADSDQSDPLFWLDNFSNVVLLRTFSKSWGMAGARLGLALASGQIIDLMNRIKPPYNINSLSQAAALKQMSRSDLHRAQLQTIVGERQRIHTLLTESQHVVQTYTSDANFLLIQFADPRKAYQSLIDAGIVVRDRTSAVKDCLRISIGTPEENNRLIDTLKSIS